MITYKDGKDKNGDTKITVYIDGKVSGTIERNGFGLAWSYFPKGKTQGGKTYATIAEVKRSLESE